MRSMLINSRTIRRVFSAALLLMLGVALTHAQQTAPASAPATRPTTGRAASADYELYEWAVFVLDANQPQLNAAGLFTTTVPEFVKSSRTAAPAAGAATQPSPIGVIRLVGSHPA